MATLTWYGHSAFKIEANHASILIDPFFAPGCGFSWRDAGKIDLILVTHDHGDHVGDTVEICRHWKAALGCVVGTAQALVERGVPKDQVLNGIGFNIGGTLEFRGAAITMTQAFHSSDSGVPTGFILHLPDNLVLYHAGDTGVFSSMELLGKMYGIKLALLPIGGVFTMDGFQAAHAALLLGCRKVVPMHWGTFPVLAQNTDTFCKDLGEITPGCVCKTMKPGETMEI